VQATSPVATLTVAVPAAKLTAAFHSLSPTGCEDGEKPANFRHMAGSHFAHRQWMEARMKRLYFAVILAGATMIGTGGASWAQMYDTPAPGAQTQTTQPMSSGANAPAARNAAKSQRKAQRVAARSDCRAQAKQQSLSGQGLRDYVKSCVARHN
jgi:hypothetical protein